MWTLLTATSTMILCQVFVSLLSLLTRSTPICMVDERSNIIYIYILLALHNSYNQPFSALEEICQTATYRTPQRQTTNIMFWQSQQPHIHQMYSLCHQDMLIHLLFPLHYISLPPAPLPLQYYTHILCM